MQSSKQSYRPTVLGGGVLGLALIVASCLTSPPAAHGSSPHRQAMSPCTGFGVQPVSISTTLPVSFSPAVQQNGADCMAWQEFISLNWAADPSNRGQPDKSVPASSFGTVDDPAPKVWQSYWEASSVFSASQARQLLKAPMPKVLKLSRITKQGNIDLSLSNIGQAGDGKWLTDQSGNLTYYEVLLNQDELDYITQNNLTTYAGQAACVSAVPAGSAGGFNLPAGGGLSGQQSDVSCGGTLATYGQNTGAIEIKAAWRILPSDHSLDYRYETSPAQVTPPGGQPTMVTVGLVGLHILHKVLGAPNFVWATFEQIDNCPNESSTSGPNYTYFSQSCDPTTNAYHCVHNALPGTPCDPNNQPPGCDPYSATMQITRVTPVDNTAQGVTNYVYSLLGSSSVFKYYRLINVQWPSTPTTITAGATTPLSTGGITPSDTQGIVANCTLETYQQKSNSCMDCHQGAPIATGQQRVRELLAGKRVTKVQVREKTGSTASYASDYSFIFSSETNH